MTDKLKDAEDIASDIAGFSVGIRFLPPEPLIQTGFPLTTNVVGAEFAHQLRFRANGNVGIHTSVALPEEWRQGLDDLIRRGIVVLASQTRLWTAYTMPDPVQRRTFGDWGTDHQERRVEPWEEF
ncbi:MAG: hypothetical protein EOO77_45145, partial [Oxalobacteraceae bacterium]